MSRISDEISFVFCVGGATCVRLKLFLGKISTLG